MKKKFFKVLFLICVGLVFLTGCGENSGSKKYGKPIVYTSFFPIYDMVSTVAGDKLDVRSFMPLDKEAHLWEPSAKDMKDLDGADLFIINGANMETWIDSIKENLPNLDILTLSDSVKLISHSGAAEPGDFQYMARLDLKPASYTMEFGHTHEHKLRGVFFKDDGSDLKALSAKAHELMKNEPKNIKAMSTFDVEDGALYEFEMQHNDNVITFNIKDGGKWIFASDRVSSDYLPYVLVSENGQALAKENRLDVLFEESKSKTKVYDPHSWISLRNAKHYFEAIQNKLSEKYPENEKYFKENASKAIARLDELEKTYKEKFRDVKNRDFVIVHGSFAYVARDFDLIQHPLQELTSLESPSLNAVKTAIAFAKKKNITTVFYEYGHSSKEAQALAEEIGGKISPLASMEFVNDKEEKSHMGYIDLMEMNMKNLYDSFVN